MPGLRVRRCFFNVEPSNDSTSNAVHRGLVIFPVSSEEQGSLCAGLSRGSPREMVGWAPQGRKVEVMRK